VNGSVVKGPIKGVGMAFQNPTLMPWRNTMDNILLPMEVVEPHKRRFRRHRAEYEKRAMALLETVGLTDFARKFPWQLSGGMQQRSNLCRALIHEPELLMLDEPFGALDAFTREELWGVMQTLWLEKRFTGVLVTHDLREAAYLASRICVMTSRPGRILQDSPVPFERPRTLEKSYSPEFASLVQQLRMCIAQARTEDDPSAHPATSAKASPPESVS
jgi:NitT/TauT family transport system ATP-binding protein